MKTVYICDTQKNTPCRKTNCHENGGPCHLTTEEQYELLGEATEAQKRVLAEARAAAGISGAGLACVRKVIEQRRRNEQGA